jgi:hypothetical protein
MNSLSWYWPLEWPNRVGFHKPTAPALTHGAQAATRRASSPRFAQGGRLELLMQGIWPPSVHSPHNRRSTVVGLASPSGSAHPTTPGPSPSCYRSLGMALRGCAPWVTPGFRTCLRHLLTPWLAGGGRLPPTTERARNSPLNPLPSRAEEWPLRGLLFHAGASEGPASERRADKRWMAWEDVVA